MMNQAKKAMRKKIKVGIIGFGIGEKHFYGYQRHPDCEVIAICDFDDIKINKIIKKYPEISITKEADEILERNDIDVVSIASYDNYHYEHIMKGLKNNKHIFVEKPLCLYENEAIKISKMLKERDNLYLSSNLVLRANPIFKKVKILIDKSKFGELFYVEGAYNYGKIEKIIDGWRGKIYFYSVVYGGAIHIIDLIMWLTGEKVIEISAYGCDIATRETDFKYNDLVTAIMRFENGMVGKVTANFGCVHPHFHELALYGRKATYINQIREGIIFKYNKNKIYQETINCKIEEWNKIEILDSFINGIIEKRNPAVTVSEIFDVMSVCFAMEKASHSRKAVKVKYL